jgi:hypothetical protein
VPSLIAWTVTPTTTAPELSKNKPLTVAFVDCAQLGSPNQRRRELPPQKGVTVGRVSLQNSPFRYTDWTTAGYTKGRGEFLPAEIWQCTAGIRIDTDDVSQA